MLQELKELNRMKLNLRKRNPFHSCIGYFVILRLYFSLLLMVSHCFAW